MIITIVIVVIIILLVAATASSGFISRGTAVAGSAFAPLQTFFYNISDGIAGFFRGSSSVSQEEQTALMSELDQYKTQMLDYDEIIAENQRLAAMLEYKQNNVNYDLKVAAITGKEPGNWFEVFTIDIGANDGIAVDMPVITADGLVGRVSEVGLNWAKIIAIIDGRSRVSVIMERTRDVGIAGGTLNTGELDRTLSMEFLPLDSDIVEGDVVVTSGLDGIYPKGLTVGTVKQTRTAAGSVSLTIEPDVDFRRLEEVMVVVAVAEGDTSAAADDITDPAAHVEALPTEGAGDTGNDEGSPDETDPDAQGDE